MMTPDPAGEAQRPPIRWYTGVNGACGLLWAFGIPALFWYFFIWSPWIKAPAVALWLVLSPLVVDRYIPRVMDPMIEWVSGRLIGGRNSGGKRVPAVLAFKEPDVPGVGEQVDRSFTVDLPRTLHGPLLTITAESASIIVSRTLIERTAAHIGTTWKTEEERLQLIAADDARELLGRIMAGEGPSDGGTVAADSLGHSRYLVAKLLRSGCCMVVPAGSRDPVSRITVRYVGEHPADLVGHGTVLFMLEDPPNTFLTVEWFVS